MKTSTLATFIFLASSSAFAQECVDLAKVIGREARRFGSADQIDILNKSNFCSEKYDSASNTQRVNIEASYAIFSGSAGGSSQQIKTTQEKICEGQFGAYWRSQVQSSEIQKVSEIGADVISACINARNFRLTSMRVETEAVAASFRFGGSGATTISGVSITPEGIAKCHAQISGKTIADLSKLSGMSLPSQDNLQINCERIAIESNSTPPKKHYRGGLLAVATQSDTAIVPFIAYDDPPASEPLIDSLRRDIEAEKNRTTSLIERIEKFKIAVEIENALNDISTPGGEKNCPQQNQVVVGFKNTPDNNWALDMWRCATIRLKKD